MGKIAGTFLVACVIVMAADTGRAEQAAPTDHLEPVKTATQAAIGGDKSGEIELILYREAFQPNVRARVLVEVFPCGCEFMAFIVQDGTTFKLVDLYSDATALSYARPPTAPRGMPELPPPDPRKAHILRKETPVSSGLAGAIVADWKKLLFQTGYLPNRFKGTDGVYYTLSMEDKTGDFAGWSNNAESGEPTLGALQHVIFAMALVCDGEKDVRKCFQPNVNELQKEVSELSRLLK